MLLLWAAFGYLIGSVLPGYVIFSVLRGKDIRGFDFPGTAGTFRQLGAFWGFLVLVLDIAKGFLAFAVPAWFGATTVSIWASSLAAVAGHCWPVYLQFNGGAGVATLGGVALGASPTSFLIGNAAGVLVATALLPFNHHTHLGPMWINIQNLISVIAGLVMLAFLAPERFWLVVSGCVIVGVRALQKERQIKRGQSVPAPSPKK